MCGPTRHETLEEHCFQRRVEESDGLRGIFFRRRDAGVSVTRGLSSPWILDVVKERSKKKGEWSVI